MIEVKSRSEAKENQNVELKLYTNKDGEVVETTEKQIAKELSPTINPNSAIAINELSPEQFEERIKHRLKAVAAIKKHFVEGKHTLQLEGSDQSFMTQEGADLLFSSAGIEITTKIISETIKEEMSLYIVKAVAIAKMNGNIVAQLEAAANSKEAVHRKVFETFDKKTEAWIPRKGKSFYDVIPSLDRKAQKRAKVALARQFFAATGEFGEENENPKANKRKHQMIYQQLYKWFLEDAPEAPKKTKLKNGKWKFFDEKEKLTWRKEWVRATILQPNLIRLGLHTHEWGIKDIELLKEEIPNFKLPAGILNKKRIEGNLKQAKGEL